MTSVPASRRDVLITFQERTGTQDDATGAYTYTWADVSPSEWAQVTEIVPRIGKGEEMSDGADLSLRQSRVRCLYRSDIDPSMRVAFGGRTYEIVSGPAQLGRREGLEFICQEYSTQGDAP